MIAICPDSEQLYDYSNGLLPEERSDELFSHIASCRKCQELLDSDSGQDDPMVGLVKQTAGGFDQPADFADESQCQSAMARALAALADVDRHATENLPQQIGDYDIIRLIGRGGMGSIYLAKHTKLDKDVALKVIAAHRLSDPKMRDRFESEMRAVGKLNHPNIVAALDAREVDSTAVLITEWIDGMDLGEIVRRVGPLSIADASQIACQVASALSAINSAGLVHRDIKPSNIMIDSAGNTKLMDLGLARLQDETQQNEFTATGQAIGTADYLAPEQIHDPRHVDIRADVYSLGCTLFKLLTGRAPFADQSTAFAKMTAHVSSDPPQLSDFRDDLPQPLVATMERMFSKQPAGRPQSLADIASTFESHAKTSDLKSLIERAKQPPIEQISHERNQPDGESKLQSQNFWHRRVPMTVAIAAGLAGILIGLICGVIITIKHPDGTVTKLDVPNGSQVVIDEQGNAEVQLPDGEQAAANVNADPNNRRLSDAQKLNGVWKIEYAMENGVRTDRFADRFPAIVFFNGISATTGIPDPSSVIFAYKVHDDLEPPQIRPSKPRTAHDGGMVYQFNSDGTLDLFSTDGIETAAQLTFENAERAMRLRRIDTSRGSLNRAENLHYQEAILLYNKFASEKNLQSFVTKDPDAPKDQSPKKTVAHVDPNDSRKIQNVWRVVNALNEEMIFPSAFVFQGNRIGYFSNNEKRAVGYFSINPYTDPKHIDFTIRQSGTADQVESFKGIYRFLSDGSLQIRYDQGGFARPRKFLDKHQVGDTYWQARLQPVITDPRFMSDQTSVAQSWKSAASNPAYKDVAQPLEQFKQWSETNIAKPPKAISNFERLSGVWQLEMFRNGEIVPINPWGPNLIVLGPLPATSEADKPSADSSPRGRVLILRDNFEMAQGSFNLSRSIAFSSIYFTEMSPPEPIIHGNGVHFWLPKALGGQFRFVDPDLVECDVRDLSKGPPTDNDFFIKLRMRRVTLPTSTPADTQTDGVGIPEMAALEANRHVSQALIYYFEWITSGQPVDVTSGDKIRQIKAYNKSVNNIRRLVFACHSFHDVHKRLPMSMEKRFTDTDTGTERFRAVSVVPKDRPPHSWRVAILPFIGRADLYNQYRFDEPWDSPANRKLLNKMPEVFRDPETVQPTERSRSETRYRGITGKGAGMPKDVGFSLEQYEDGTSRTVFLIEAAQTVPWTKPADIEFDEELESQPIASWFKSSPSPAGFADGSIRTINFGVPLGEHFKSFFTRSGNDMLPPDVWEKLIKD